MKSGESVADSLTGLRVLIVEDEALVAMLLEEYLSDLGCVVTSSERRVAPAMQSLSNIEIDAAVLDLNVAGESIEPLADALADKGIPFIFASGYGAPGISARWERLPVLQKPFTMGELKQALQKAVAKS